MVKRVRKRKIYWKYYLLAGVLTCLVFVIGLMAGILIEASKVTFLEKKLKELEISKTDSEVKSSMLSLLNANPCEAFEYEVEKLIPKVSKFGEELEVFEATRKGSYQEYLALKKEYTLMNLRYWMFVKSLKEKCNYSFVPILYFYSNKNCPACKDQGYVLSLLKKKYPKKVMIFAIDGDLDLESVSLLKKVYNITAYPSLIINGRVYKGLKTTSFLEKIIGVER